MKRHVAAVVALITSLVVIDNHLDWVHQDGRLLLEVSGQRFDLHGWASEQVLQLRRDCSAVTPQTLDSPTANAVLAVIQQHSLPDSRSARTLQVLELGEWSVTEVHFDTLNPSLVVLHRQAGQWRVQDRAVWSGSTAPWHSADFVRRYLRQQAPALPQALLDCVAVEPARYGTGPGGLGPVTLHVTSHEGGAP
jgi:hypothetical protein